MQRAFIFEFVAALLCHFRRASDSQAWSNPKLQKLLQAAPSHGCENKRDEALTSALAAVKQLECMINNWLGASQRNSRAIVSARGTAQIFTALDDFGAGGLGPDDNLAILASGSGKAGLQAYLTTDVNKIIGIEENATLHLAAIDGQQQLESALKLSDASLDAQKLLRFVHGNATDNIAFWQDASVVLMEIRRFQAMQVLELSWSLSENLLPGALIISVGAPQLPGCHPGLMLGRTMFVATTWDDKPSHTFVHIYIVAPRQVEPAKQSWLAWRDSAAEQEMLEQFRRVAKSSVDLVSVRPENLNVPILAWINAGLETGWGEKLALTCATAPCAGQIRRQLQRLLVTAVRGTVSGAKQGIGCQYCAATHAKFSKADAIWASRPHPESLHWKTWNSVLQARAGIQLGRAECAWAELKAVLEALPGQREKDDEALHLAIRRFLASPSESSSSFQLSYQHDIIQLVVGDHEGDLSTRVLDDVLRFCSADAVNMVDASGKTLLHSVSAPAAAKRLLTNRMDVNAASYNGETPLHHAVDERSLGLVELFLSHGADTESRDNMRMTPLLRAAMLGDTGRIPDALLKARAVVDALDGTTRSALHWAVRSRNEKLTSVLVKAGADPNIRNSGGIDVLGVARERGNEKIIEMILDVHPGGTALEGARSNDL